MVVLGNRVFISFLLCLPSVLWGANRTAPGSWTPARWQGGPLEVFRRAQAKDLPADAATRDAIANWYDAASLNLLNGSPVNCLLVTWSAGADAELERRQRQLVKAYAVEAHKRDIAVLGLVYPGSDPSKAAAAAVDAGLDGLVPDGDFPSVAEFTGKLEQALASVVPVIPILRDPALGRTASRTVAAVQGVSPSARNLADMGIRSGPSSEPWIDSNIWLVRSFRVGRNWRPVWIDRQPDGGSAADYARCVADAAVAGGRWIVALDDALRAKLRANDAAALAVWRRVETFLGFAEKHDEWRKFAPYGNLALILDAASADPDMQEEYLKLVARRQIPYRLILRSQLGAASLAGFRAVLATGLAPPSDQERSVLRAFAGRGGLVVAGPSWGDPPKDDPYAERLLDKGRVAVYKDPDPESVARDMRDLLSTQDRGVVAFNALTAIVYASSGGAGKPLLVQLLNYAGSPAEAITIRVAGLFKTARWYVPEAEPVTLAMKREEGKTDVSIPKLPLWGALLLE
jgi:hypothetical protein